MNEHIIYSLDTIHNIESTYDESDSYYIFNKYSILNPTYKRYSFPSNMHYQDISSVFNGFCFFYAKVQENSTSPRYYSFIPLGVIRFMLHEDLSFSAYHTPKRKHGLVVEGFIWSNGLLYQIRQDLKKDFQVHEVTCILEPATATLMNIKDETIKQ